MQGKPRNSDQTLKVLRALAARDARAIHLAEDDAEGMSRVGDRMARAPTSAPQACAVAHARESGVVRIIRGSLAKSSELMAAGPETLHTLKSAGWVVRDEAQSGLECWRLSNAGRLHLKRALSRVPAGSPQASPDAGSPAVSRTHDVEGQRRGRRAPSKTSPGTNFYESPLGWLRRRKDKSGRPMLSAVEFNAGEKLRADFTFAQMDQRVTASWSPTAGVAKGARSDNDRLDVADEVADAQERVRKALAALEPDFANILLDVCCYLKGLEAAEAAAALPKRSGKIVLIYALRALARHYGMRN